jgi:acetyl-CoA acetyltransferase
VGTSKRMMDQVAVVGVGSAPYSRDSQRSMLSLGLEAARNAIQDAGIDKNLIDGLCGYGMSPVETHGAGFLSVQGALGITETNWVLNSWSGSNLIYSAQAVYSGLADYCLVIQVEMRSPHMSAQAASDPFRVNPSRFGKSSYGVYSADWIHTGQVYAAWLNKYMADYKVSRQTLGLIAINHRQWASRNPAAVKREPITMDDYLSARPIWEPFGVLDMDLPVDGAEALVLTTADRARDMKNKPVYLHSMSLGGTRVGEYYENGIAWDKTCPWASNKGVWSRTDLTTADLDLFYPYDGYMTTAVSHIEASGFCGVGEAKDLLEDSWDEKENIIKLNGGRTMVMTNGGGFSHGRMSGFNFFTEAARQLRGTVEPDRQVPDAKVALASTGSFHHDSAAVIMRVD